MPEQGGTGFFGQVTCRRTPVKSKCCDRCDATPGQARLQTARAASPETGKGSAIHAPGQSTADCISSLEGYRFSSLRSTPRLWLSRLDSRNLSRPQPLLLSKERTGVGRSKTCAIVTARLHMRPSSSTGRSTLCLRQSVRTRPADAGRKVLCRPVTAVHLGFRV